MTQRAQQAAADGVGALVAEAVESYRAGRWEEAEQRCAAVLQAEHNNVRILALFGTLHALRGSCEEAVRLIGLSLNLEPRQPFALNTMGNAHRALKRNQEAAAAYEKAIALRPSLAAAHCNLGLALIELGRPEDAIASFDKAIALEPGNAEALFGRGNALRNLQRLTDALSDYDKAIQVKPDYTEAYANRGATLCALNRLPEAGESYDKAIALQPTAETFKSAGDYCMRLNHIEPALVLYDSAIALRPDYSPAHYMRAIALRTLDRYGEALASLDKAIELNPTGAYSVGERLFVKSHLCHWEGLRADCDLLESMVARGIAACNPATVLSIPHTTPALLLKCAERHVADACPPHPVPNPGASAGRRRHDRIRLAYVSSNFRKHAGAFLTTGMFEEHDRDKFELFAISFTQDDGSELRTRLENAFEHFFEVREKNDDEIATLMMEHEIDIAVDLKGYSAGCRPGIFARRPAPVQVNYLGYPATMAASYIDYIVADRIVIPEDEHPLYTEKVVYLPDTYQCNDSNHPIAKSVPTRAEAGLPPEGFVFCAFNNPYKLGPAIFDIWMRLLHQVPGSTLWILESRACAVENLRREAANRGIASERLVFAPKAPNPEHLARHQLADLFLDTLPLCAHTTASDALWAGLPVLTCVGNTFGGRVAASLLHAVGLPEMVTHSLAQYEARALALARDRSALAAIRAKLARNRDTHPLFDTRRFTRHIEKAYAGMWQRYCDGAPPGAFAVEAAE